MNNPLISVIMPVKNGANYMAEAIEGIKKQKMNVEIIVVNDGSTDNTPEIAAAMGCRVINNPVNQGGTKTRNIGLQATASVFIMFHDHDDIMRKGALCEMYTEFEKNPELQVVMAKVQDFVSPELSEAEQGRIQIKPQSYYGLLTGAVLFRKEVFDIIGTFDETLKYVQGVELQMRFGKYNIEVGRLALVSVNRRVHTSNIGRTNRQKQLQNQIDICRRSVVENSTPNST